MRFLLSSWIIIIFLLTCTNNVYRIFEGKLAFVLASNPHWTNLLTLYPLSEISKFEFMGHFILFFILTALLIDVLKSIPRAALFAVLYGIVTELLQPYFSRGAEGVDLLANIVGIMTYVGLYGTRKVGLGMIRGKETGLESRTGEGGS